MFIALPLPPKAVKSIEKVQARFPAGRLTPADNLHLTLAFLDEQPEENASAVHDGLITVRAPRFEVALSTAAVFGGRGGQSVALEAEGGAPLHELHDRLRARLRGAGVVTERRRFRPHVTLARLPGQGNAGPLLAALPGVRIGPFPAESFCLYASTLHRDGARHEVLAQYPLHPPSDGG